MAKMIMDHVLVKEVEEEGKVILPEKAKLYPDKGEVMAVGPGDAYGYPEFMSTTVKVGDIIYYSKDRAYRVKMKAGDRYVIKERDCLMILEGDE